MAPTRSHNQTEGPIQLKWDGGSVVITPQDEDRFVWEAQRAVSACQTLNAFDRFLQQFKEEFLRGIHNWCEDHREKVLSAFVVFLPTQLQVFVVTKSPRYDFELSDPLSDFEMELFQQNWDCEILQIPDGSLESLATFFDPKKSIQVYGPTYGTSSEGGEPQEVPRNDP